MDFRAAMNFAKYDDDEPRDDRGRWAGKGGGAYQVGVEDHAAGRTSNPFAGQTGREQHARAWEMGVRSAQAAADSKAQRAAKPAHVPAPSINDHVARLAASDVSDGGRHFADAVDRLTGDKSIKKPDMDRVAQGYIGMIGRSSWPTKAAALSAIHETFRSRQFERVKLIQVGRAGTFGI